MYYHPAVIVVGLLTMLFLGYEAGRYTMMIKIKNMLKEMTKQVEEAAQKLKAEAEKNEHVDRH